VVNGGLEDVRFCPEGPVLDRLKVDGRVKAAQGDPDLYQACSNTFGVPENWSGTQAAWEGEGYAGLVLTTDAGEECARREYLQFPLRQPLKNGHRYRLTFQVSCAEYSGYVTDRAGAIFTTKSYARRGLPPGLRERADVSNALGELLSDTAAWSTVSGIYSARGGERFVIVGNFHPCNRSTRVRLAKGVPTSMKRMTRARMDPVRERGRWRECLSRTAYVYIDGVSLMPDTAAGAVPQQLDPGEACPEDTPPSSGIEYVLDPGFNNNGRGSGRGWRNASGGTPDFFDGYLGLYLYTDINKDNREYVRIPLAGPLDPCATYRVSMDVRRSAEYAYAVDAIGIALTDTFHMGHGRDRLRMPWAWRSPPGRLITDTREAVTLCGTFRPTMCARQLILGNFAPDSATWIHKAGGGGPYAYVFVDNVHVGLVSREAGCITSCIEKAKVVEDTAAAPWSHGLVLRFDSDSDIPLGVDTLELGRLAEELNTAPDRRVLLTGHTDDTGSTNRNEDLGLARAVRLRDLLIAYGADASRIEVRTMGSTVPVADNADPGGRALNRRVELELR